MHDREYIRMTYNPKDEIGKVSTQIVDADYVIKNLSISDFVLSLLLLGIIWFHLDGVLVLVFIKILTSFYKLICMYKRENFYKILDTKVDIIKKNKANA